MIPYSASVRWGLLMRAWEQTPGAVSFGSFELDASLRELRKNGRRVRLQEQPLRILLLLVEAHGELVSRERLRQFIWPEDTLVSFDHSLATAIAKIREALGDSIQHPRFIETVPRRGYRFIARVRTGGRQTLPDAGPDASIENPPGLGAGCESMLGDGAKPSPDARRTLPWAPLLFAISTIVLLAALAHRASRVILSK